MSDALFILALCLPPTVVVLGFLALLLPVRSVTQVTATALVRQEPSSRTPGPPTHVSRLIAQPLSH